MFSAPVSLYSCSIQFYPISILILSIFLIQLFKNRSAITGPVTVYQLEKKPREKQTHTRKLNISICTFRVPILLLSIYDILKKYYYYMIIFVVIKKLAQPHHHKMYLHTRRKIKIRIRQIAAMKIFQRRERVHAASAARALSSLF